MLERGIDMSLVRQEDLNIIEERLAMISSKVKLANTIHHYDINVELENFCVGLLNLVYGWNLVNINHSSQNTPAIDLGDEMNKVSVQVTSRTDKAKVVDALDKFVDNHYQNKYDKLFILMLEDKQRSYSIDEKEYSGFFSKENIWDFRDIMKEINGMATKSIEEIKEYIDREYPYSVDRKECQHIDILISILHSIDECDEGKVAIEAQAVLPDELLAMFNDIRRMNRDLNTHKQYLDCLLEKVYSCESPEIIEEINELEKRAQMYDDDSEYNEYMCEFSALIDVPYLEKKYVYYEDEIREISRINEELNSRREELKEKLTLNVRNRIA